MDVKNTEAMIELLKKELGPIGDALGQGAAKTFEIFVKQAYVVAFQNLLWIPVGLVALFVGILMYRQGSKKGEYGKSKWEGFEWVTLLGGIIICLLAVLLPLTYLIQVYVNPNYAALNLMLETFRQSR